MELNYLRVISPDLARLVEEKNASDLAWHLVEGKRQHREGGSQLYDSDPRPDQDIERELVDEWLKNPDIAISQLVNHVKTGVEQLAAEYRQGPMLRPEQLTLASIHDSPSDLQTLWACQQIEDFLASEELEVAVQERIALRSGVLLIYGIGALNEIARLVTYLQPRIAIIFEADLDLLALVAGDPPHAKTLAMTLAQTQCKLFVIPESDTIEAATMAEGLIGGINITSLAQIGSFTFHPSPVKESVNALLCKDDQLSHSLAYQGFFIDELNMLLNSLVTSTHTKTRIVTPRNAHKAHERHAVVVASGPSLKQALNHLKQHRERFDIFCSWSTLGALLEAGIQPDYHCHMERHADHETLATVPAAVQAARSCYLVGSASIDPRLAALYKDAAIFLRSASACSVFLADEWEDIIGSEGTQASNAAVVMATLLGYRTLHLFGTDFGAAEPKESKRVETALFTTPRNMTEKAPGNRREAVWTDKILKDAADWLGLYIEIFQKDSLAIKEEGLTLTAYNYSDGIRINNTITADPDHFHANLTRSVPLNQPAILGIPSEAPLKAETKYLAFDFQQRITSYIQQTEALLSEPFSQLNLERFIQLSERYMNLRSDQVIGRLFNGTLTRIWLILQLLDHQLIIVDAEQRQRWKLKASEILLATINSMRALADEMLNYYERLDDLSSYTLKSTRL